MEGGLKYQKKGEEESKMTAAVAQTSTQPQMRLLVTKAEGAFFYKLIEGDSKNQKAKF